MEAIGAAAAIADLLGLSIKVGKAVKSLTQSFTNAPTELLHLVSRLDHLHMLINQTRCLFEELTASDSIHLLPPEHQLILSTCFQSNFDALRSIQTLCCVETGTSEKIGNRLRWASLDKKKAGRILAEVSKAELELKTVLTILTVRISSFNRTSLEALRASQALLHEDLKESTESIKLWMRTEFQSLSDKTSCSPSESLKPSVYKRRLTEVQFNKDETFGRVSTRSSTVLEDQTMYPIKQNRALGALQSTGGIFGDGKFDDAADPGWRLIEHDMRKSLFQYSVVLGSLREPATSRKGGLTVGSSLTLQVKRNRRRMRAIFNIGFNIFCQHVLQFELEVQQIARHWLGFPSFKCAMKVFNVRPSDAPIFSACQRKDVHEVRYLLESGQASIYDVDDEVGGLLEHTVRGEQVNTWYTYDSEELRRMKVAVQHLQDQGCDPNSFYGRITEGRLPAAVCAFDNGYSAVFSTMLANGADMVSYSSILGNCLLDMNAGVSWKVQVLRDMEFSDWNSESNIHGNNLLHAACNEANLERLMFALHSVGISPNSEGSHRTKPLNVASAENFLKGASLLVESGAEVNQDNWMQQPLFEEPFNSSWPTDTHHFLLLHGANPKLNDTGFRSTWGKIWYRVVDFKSSWSFTHFEGGLAHLLLHGDDPFESRVDLGSLRHVGWRYLEAPEIARCWSYRLRKWRFSYNRRMILQQWAQRFDTAETKRSNLHPINWSNSGRIYFDQRLMPDFQEMRHESSPLAGNSASFQYDVASYVEQDGADNSLAGNEEHGQDPDSTSYSEPDGEDVLDDDWSDGPTEDDCLAETFFRDQTQFYHHTKTEEGRRRLSRFPMVLAFCDALRFAGYRAEMDDEGDIWYDDDDCDRYFDAREYQPAVELDDCDPAFCPICQDFERHGLGHILRTAEEARREFAEYKEKVRDRKRNYF